MCHAVLQISKYFSGHDLQYYFQVNDQYVKNKIKVVLFPFLHRVSSAVSPASSWDLIHMIGGGDDE